MVTHSAGSNFLLLIHFSPSFTLQCEHNIFFFCSKRKRELRECLKTDARQQWHLICGTFFIERNLEHFLMNGEVQFFRQQKVNHVTKPLFAKNKSCIRLNESGTKSSKKKIIRHQVNLQKYEMARNIHGNVSNYHRNDAIKLVSFSFWVFLWKYTFHYTFIRVWHTVHFWTRS